MSVVSPDQPDTLVLINEAIGLLTAAASAISPGLVESQRETTRLVPGRVLRLLAAGSNAEDPADIGIPLAEARLVAVHADSPADLTRLLRTAPPPRRWVHSISNAEWLLLVPGLPRRNDSDAGLCDARRWLGDLQRCGGSTWSAGVSGPLENAADAPRACRDARDAAGLAARDGCAIVVADEEWARLSYARLRAAARDAVPDRSPAARLATHDNDHGTAFGATLGTWLSLNCDADATSRVLSIHPNTVRYRLRRAESLVGLDLSDPQQRLVLHLTQPAAAGVGSHPREER